MEVKTFCRICEPLCGLTATVQDGRITNIKPNTDHVHSKGHFCVKAKAAVDVTYDEDRVLQPMRRTGRPGEFKAVSWDEALKAIAHRLNRVRADYGNDAVAIAQGNPTAFSYATSFFIGGFQSALDVKWRYAPNADDAAARHAASQFNFGSLLKIPIPDVWRSDFVLIIGANPKVSHSSIFSEPRLMEALRSRVTKGGRVVVVDPRRTETAREFEHIPIVSGQDPSFLIVMLRTILEEHLFDAEVMGKYAAGTDEFRLQLERFDLADCAAKAGMKLLTIQQLARDFAASPSACIYGRTGTCTQLFGTFTNMLLDFLSLLTGNLHSEGGNVFAWSPIDFETMAEKSGWASFNKAPTRVHKHPDVFGVHPTTSFVPDTLVPGKGRVRALVSIASNMALSSPVAGEPIEQALNDLDFHVSLDFYMNETNKFADYILPVPTFYEREDFPMVVMSAMLRPSLFATPAVVDKIGDCREEWKILNDICKHMGLGGAYASPFMRLLSKCGIKTTPKTMFDILLRTSKSGDKFGLSPSGLSAKKLLTNPDGINLKAEIPLADLSDMLRTENNRVNLCSDTIISEFARLGEISVDPEYPYRLFGRREVKSINSWLHNIRKLMPDGRTNCAIINSAEAAKIGVETGQDIEISSTRGKIVAPVLVNDDVGSGQVSLPHGWGHNGGWKNANDAGGINSNLLAGYDRADLEPLAGMSVLNGIPVSIRAAH